MYSGPVFHHFQDMAGTSFDATPASGTIAFHHMDDFVPVLPFAMQVEGNPQKDHNSHTDIYCIHSLSFLYDYLFMQTNGTEEYFTE
jgi:hypothetical protein